MRPERARHDRDGQEEGELKDRAGAAHAEEGADDGGAAAGRAGDERQHLPRTDDKRLPVGDAAQLGGGGHTGAALDEDERDAVDDQHDRDDDAVIKCASIQSSSARPSTAAGRQATMILNHSRMTGQRTCFARPESRPLSTQKGHSFF